MAYQPIPNKEQGGQKEVWVADEVVRSLLQELIVEVRKLNIHLELINDEQIKEEDINDNK